MPEQSDSHQQINAPTNPANTTAELNPTRSRAARKKKSASRIIGEEDSVFGKTSPHLLLVDGHNLLFRAYTSLPVTIMGVDGAPIHGVYGFLSILLRLRREFNVTHLIVCFDPAERPFRQDLFPAYRAHRVDGPASDMENFHAQLQQLLFTLDKLHVATCIQPGFEADDAMGTLARRAEKSQMMVTILSTDKDMLQMVSDRIRVYAARGSTGTYYTPAEVLAKFGVQPAQFVDLKALMGDPSDNIPGLPGVGPKTATKLLQEYGSLSGIYAHLDHIPVKLAGILRTYKDEVWQYHQLCTIISNAPLAIEPEDCLLPDLDVTTRAGEVLEQLGLRERTTPVAPTAE